jgi:hypothetical protein
VTTDSNVEIIPRKTPGAGGLQGVCKSCAKGLQGDLKAESAGLDWIIAPFGKEKRVRASPHQSKVEEACHNFA